MDLNTCKKKNIYIYFYKIIICVYLWFSGHFENFKESTFMKNRQQSLTAKSIEYFTHHVWWSIWILTVHYILLSFPANTLALHAPKSTGCMQFETYLNLDMFN